MTTAEDPGRYEPSKTPPTTDKKGILTQYLGVITSAQKAFLIELEQEHRNTVEISFTEKAATRWVKAETTATVKSRDQNKINYVKFMLEREYERAEKEKAEKEALLKEAPALTKLLNRDFKAST